MVLLSIYAIGQAALPGFPWIWIAAVGIVAFNPSFLFMTSTAHIDSLMAAIYALALWWLTRALKTPPSAGAGLLGGLLLGAGLLTKLTGLSLVPLFGLTLLLSAWRAGAWRRGLLTGGIVFGLAALVAGWWYLRNQILYGDPLGWRMYLATYDFLARRGAYTWEVFQGEFLGQISRTTWGAFGYLHITLPAPTYQVLWGLSGLAWLGAVAAAIGRGRLLRLREHWPQWLVLLMAAAIVSLSLVRHSWAITGAGHGRHFFTIAAPLALILALGLNGLSWLRAQRSTALVVTAGLAAYAGAVLALFVLPLYRPPEVARADDLATAVSSGIVFGDRLELVASRRDGAASIGDGTALATLYWRGVGAERPDLFTVVRVRDRWGSIVHEQGTWPVPSSSTAVWDTATIYASRLAEPARPLPQIWSLEVLVRPGRDGNLLPAQDSEGQALGVAPTVLAVPARAGDILDEPTAVAGQLLRRLPVAASIAVADRRWLAWLVDRPASYLLSDLTPRTDYVLLDSRRPPATWVPPDVLDRRLRVVTTGPDYALLAEAHGVQLHGRRDLSSAVLPDRPREGDLIKDSGPTVFRLTAGRLRPIPDPETLLCQGFEPIWILADGEVDAIPRGPQVPDRDGCAE